MKEVFERLRNSIKGEVLLDDYSLGMYSTDASIYQIRPLAIVLPRDTDDVKMAIGVAFENGVTILPRGAGTSLAGQSVGRSMILDFSKYMNTILEVNVSEKWVRVQPGIVRDDLNTALLPYGLQFAPDPATGSRANVGGMVGNNSSGTKSILYGKTVDHILEASVLLADGTDLFLRTCSPEDYREKALQKNREGEIYTSFEKLVNRNAEEIKERFPKVMRRVGGYNLDEFVYTDQWNLCKLVCGSEGTLATTLELKLNLVDLPRHKSVCVVHFAAVPEAISAVASILPFKPSAVEILDKTIVDLSRENLTTRHHCHFIEGNPEAILIVEFYGDTEEDVMQRPQKMIAQLKAGNRGYAYPLFPEGESYEDVWVIRKKGLGLMLGLKGNKKPLAFIEDACIPSGHLPEYIDQVLKVCEKHGTKAAMYAHASVGVIHVRPILDLRLAEDIERLKAITEDTFELVVKYKGSWSGEHGDGLVRSAYNKRFFGEVLYNAFLEIKKLFDPDGLMNPGKIVEAQTIDNNLRYGTAYKDQTVKTEYKYKAEEGFEASVHMCTGVGECRKIIGGTMCPSFKATRDEEHSTRGRANALRLAMSDQFGSEGLSSKRLHEVMDLCLSCKACKSECPSNVDMAKMKSDTLQMYYDEHGITFRDKLIRDSARTSSKISGWKAGMVNTIQKTDLFKGFLQRTAKLDRRRTLPGFTREPFYRWFAKNAHKTNRGNRKVVLFADTYLNFHEPQVGISALHLLNSCGYEVILANAGCCQRPKISHGFLRDAKKEGARTIENLKKYLDEDLTIVVCEPSCASALNDDLPDMIADTDTSEQLINGVMMIDVFLEDELNKGRLDVHFEPLANSVAIHGHCHQKALYGTKAMKSILKHSGKEVREIPSGCCGMAGSFGYEKEHYDLSKKIGEEILFPAIQKLQIGEELVACGFSCRHQIAHFTNAKPKHFVEAIKVVKNQ